VTLNGCGDPA